MQFNTIFTTGGNSGNSRGLAGAFRNLGNRVIISGRRESGDLRGVPTGKVEG